MTHRILVVDDNPTNLKLACEVLECEGYEILQAVDAEKAQEIITSQLPDLILMDIGLPGMDGLTFTKILKANDRTKHIPIVALTAFAMKGDSQKAFDAGCDGYISKPIDIRRFPEQVAEILRLSDKPGEEPDHKPINVMVIEDEPVSRKLVCIVLEAEGHKVTRAETAETALHFIKSRKPDVIILDLKLPEMDGLALTRELKRDPKTSHIPIIAITAYPDRWSQQQVLQAGCDLYFVKPIDTRALIKHLNDHDSQHD
jgi:two-component system, cell cycle response regulator